MNRAVVFHVPHSSDVIPSEARAGLLLSDSELANELLRMTDWYTDELFAQAACGCPTVVFPVSRLVLDPERFESDEREVMAAQGMGVIYTKTSSGHRLRECPAAVMREAALAKYYRPHHARLTRAVSQCLEEHGRALIIDCHSFPAAPLPFELQKELDRPEICIGTDSFHTPAALTDTARTAFEGQGFTVDIDRPFSGALVPSRYYQKDQTVSSIMIEVRRDLYMDEVTGRRHPTFADVVHRLTVALRAITIE
ncbi:N-formylglutamate amidohydrolase [bacterium]|nr:N-formylglutamate amidohydrolase [bacterium]